MFHMLSGLLTVLARVMLCAIFLLAAVGNKIPNYTAVAQVMERAEVPYPQILLGGAIAFLIIGSVSVIVGYKARFGALLLLIFLILATYYFHAFWKLQGQAQEQQMIQFLKNLSMMGAMVFLIANGPGPWSVDARLGRQAPIT